MEKYSDAEIDALNKFRGQVADVLYDEYSRKDENLIRWLRARDLDLKKAEALLRNSMKWREENKIDSILESGSDPEMQKMFPYFMDGLDKEGLLVVTLSMGEWDIRESVERDGPEKFTHYTNQLLESAVRKMREINENSGNKGRAIRYNIICNYEGFSLRQLANMKSVNTILTMVATYEAHYPETLNTCYIINGYTTPSIFSILFGMMKPLMSARTLNKIKIFSSNRSQWETSVLEAIDPSEIREEYGGSKI